MTRKADLEAHIKAMKGLIQSQEETCLRATECLGYTKAGLSVDNMLARFYQRPMTEVEMLDRAKLLFEAGDNLTKAGIALSKLRKELAALEDELMRQDDAE